MKLRNIIMFCVAMLVAGTVSARQLSSAEALARLSNNAVNGRIKKAVRPANMQLAYTAATNGEQHYYVFNVADEQGFMILSADDLAPAVIGYVEGGSFTPDDMPPAMQWYLDGVEKQIEQSIRSGVPMFSSLKNAAGRSTIEPMITTTWGQSDPYNMLCPTVSGASSPSPSGCVATSMSQVMYYHKWPESGKGKVSYTTKTNSVSISEDLSAVRYDWGHMVNHYGYYYTEGVNDTWKKVTVSSGTTQKMAVAQLMYHCGVATKADYKASSTAITTSNTPIALYENFSYDAGLHDLERIFYSDEEWETLVYDELATGRPIIYGGSTDGGSGHSFVFDGYKDGYFHINWGWSGRPDGWFLITGDDPLRPTYQGIGGSESGHDPFINSQHMVVGIQKPVEGSVPYVSILARNGVTVKDSEGKSVVTALEKGTSYKLSGSMTLKCNGLASCTLGVALREKTTGKVTYIAGGSITNIATDKTYSAFSFTVPATLEDGTYDVIPVFKNKAEASPQWQEMLYPYGMSYPQVRIVKQIKPDTITINGEAYYTIGTADELYWFANEVNVNGKNMINAVLTADIVINENVLNADGTLNGTPQLQWTPIGNTSSQPYRGTFDGQGHTISGLYYKGTDTRVGLFGTLAGTVRNLGLVDSYLETTKQIIAGICGFATNALSGGKEVAVATISNCFTAATIYSNFTGTTPGHGGICGWIKLETPTAGSASKVTISNCYGRGRVSTSHSTKTYVNGVLGYSPSAAVNIVNSYTLTSVATTKYSTPKTAAEFANGSVTALLNNGKVDGTWAQNIANEAFPTFGNDGVNYTASTGGSTWAALCMPFAVTTSDSEMKFYEAVSVNDNGLYVKELEQEVIEGGTPFIVNVEGMATVTFRAMADSLDYALTATDGNGLCGTICGTDISTGYYLDGDLFKSAANYAAANGRAFALKPFTAYFAGAGTTADTLSIVCQSILLGDANGDGEVNIGDFTSIANYILGERNPNFSTAAADVNQDGEINVGDLTALANLILSGEN